LFDKEFDFILVKKKSLIPDQAFVDDETVMIAGSG